MKLKRFIILFFIAVLALSLTACSQDDEYGVGSGTASRADISYPDPEPSGMQFESSLVWTIVSN